MSDERRLERLEEILLRLRQTASGAAIIVEGPRDKAALETLGVGGEHLLVNQGRSLESRIDEIAEQAEASDWPVVILLLDWDRTGNRLFDRIRHGLSGRAKLDIELRRRLARAAHTSSFEEIPGDLAGLRSRVSGRP